MQGRSMKSTRIASRLFALSCLLIQAAITKAGAPEPVAVELVLAVDTSISVNAGEYRLQMHGIANAFRSPEILDIISRQPGGVAVTLVHWSLGSLNHKAVGWHHLHDFATTTAFANLVETAPRQGAGRGTSIADAIYYSVKLIEGNTYEGKSRKIDISGDSRSNSGSPPQSARDIAVARNITVNGLTIPDGDRQLVDYYRAYVIGGPDAFVLTVGRDRDFTTAMRLKLERELNIFLSSNARRCGTAC